MTDMETNVKSHVTFTTEFLSHSCTFEWYINDFTQHSLNLSLLSPMFSPAKECCTKWQMSLSSSVDGGMIVHLNRLDPFKNHFKGAFTLSVQNTRGSVLDVLTTGDIHNFAGFRMRCPVAAGIVLTKNGELFHLEEDNTLVLKLLIQQTDCCIDTKVVQE